MSLRVKIQPVSEQRRPESKATTATPASFFSFCHHEPVACPKIDRRKWSPIFVSLPRFARHPEGAYGYVLEIVEILRKHMLTANRCLDNFKMC